MRSHLPSVSAALLTILATVPTRADASQTTLQCREIPGVDKTSQIDIDLTAGTIKWTWHDMYRDYKITNVSNSFVFAETRDPIFEYQLQIDREQLIRSERKRPLFIPGSDWLNAEETKCWLDGSAPKAQF